MAIKLRKQKQERIICVLPEPNVEEKTEQNYRSWAEKRNRPYTLAQKADGTSYQYGPCPHGRSSSTYIDKMHLEGDVLDCPQCNNCPFPTMEDCMHDEYEYLEESIAWNQAKGLY